MRTIIAGSREIVDYELLVDLMEEAAAAGIFPTVVLSGTARGVDKLGERWAEENGVPLERYSADWEKFGKRAGPIRNSLMVSKAEALLVLWDGESRGTRNVMMLAERAFLKVYWKTPVEVASK